MLLLVSAAAARTRAIRARSPQGSLRLGPDFQCAAQREFDPCRDSGKLRLILPTGRLTVFAMIGASTVDRRGSRLRFDHDHLVTAD